MQLEVYDFLEKDYHKGSFIRIGWINEIILKNGTKVQKVVSTVGRLGLDYSCFNPNYIDNEAWLVRRIIKSCKNGNELLQVYTVPGTKPKTKYLIDGKEIKYADIVNDMYENDKHTHIGKVFTVSVSKIIFLGNFNIA